MRVKSFLLITLFLLSLNLVSAVQVVEVSNNPPAQTQSTGLFSVFSFLKSPIFWTIIVGLLIIAGFMVFMFFIIRWIIQYIKLRNDLFYKLKKDRLLLAKIHKRYPSKHWWKVQKNTPVRLVKKDEMTQKLIISKPIGYHRGDYTTHEGNVLISMNLEGKKKWYVYPETDLLVIPNRDKIEYTQSDGKGGKNTIVIDKIPKAKDVIQFNENDILIFAESISKVGLFLIPVLKTIDGKVIDISLPVYMSLREVALGDFLYEQTTEFASLAKTSMNVNPYIRAGQKLGDNNQNVDVPEDRA